MDKAKALRRGHKHTNLLLDVALVACVCPPTDAGRASAEAEVVTGPGSAAGPSDRQNAPLLLSATL